MSADLLASLISVAAAVAVDQLPLGLLRSRFAATVLDTLCHGVLSAIIWSAGVGLDARAVLVLLVSSGLDSDHFIEGAVRGMGFSFDAAMNLPSRPFGHSVLFVALASAVAWAVGRSQALPLPLRGSWLGPLVLVALGTHQLRDATKRGLWFPPLGHTPVFPYWLYLALVAAVTVLLRHAHIAPLASGPFSLEGWGWGCGWCGSLLSSGRGRGAGAPVEPHPLLPL
jgi:hypothetical protein